MPLRPYTGAGAGGHTRRFWLRVLDFADCRRIDDCLLCQARQHHASDAGDDVAVNQIAVSALGVAIPFVAVSGEPVVAPLPGREIIFFLHIIASFWQTNNITESRK